MLSREEALALVHAHVANKNLRKHMLAAEAVMGALADRLDGDGAVWRMAGLLHDLDYDETVGDPKRHGSRTVEMLAPRDLPSVVTDAILAHCGRKPCETVMEKAIYACDPIAGLIVAAVLMHPTRKLCHVDPEFVLKRFREKRFAAGVDRDQIRSCESLGIPLEEFVALALGAMQGISDELGL